MAINGFKVHGALVLAVLGSGVGAAIAGGGSSGVVLAGPQVLRLIQQAPAALDSYPALKMTMTVRISGHGRQGDEDMSGTMSPDGRTGSFEISIPSLGKYIDFEALSGRMYGRQAGSRQWLSCTPTAAQMSPSSTGTDGLAYLRLMPGATGRVRVVGHATIDGAKTTRYRVDIDLAKAMEAIAARQGTSVDESKVQQLQQLGISTLPVDAWLDDQHALRQFAFSEHLQGISMSFKMRMRGSTTLPSVSAPSPADVSEVSSCQELFLQLAR